MKRLLILLLCLLPGPPVEAQARQPVDYETEIQPIFTRACASSSCHGRVQSGTLLTNYDAVIASFGTLYRRLVVLPGDAVGSPLFDKISRDRPQRGGRMPRGAPRLPDEVIETIRRWIDEGALPARPLSRGDFDLNETINITDAVLLLNFLFGGGAAPACGPLVDTNADGSVNLSDAVFLLSFLFVSGPAPAPMTPAEQQGCK